jgi:23S rRNA (uracil-5-)-methyltransferase RumA
VVDIQHCHLMDQKTNTVIQIIKQILLHDHTLPIYNPKNQTWILRHLVCRRGENTDQLMINLVYADKKMNTQQKNQRSMACQALQNHEQLASLVTTCIITAHTWVSDIVHYDTGYEKLWWPGHIFEKLSRATTQVTFRISPFSFFQTNTWGAEQLFSHVASFLTKQQETILDLYCGTGTIGLSLLKQGIGKFLIGIEIVEQAVNDAWDNATINWLADQVYFAKGKAETLFRLDKTIQQHLSNITTIIVDPPRDGLHPKVVKFLNQLKTQYNFSLIYISCNPNTLARDLQWLFAWGYQCSTIQPVDMFPQTYHIETIAVLK